MIVKDAGASAAKWSQRAGAAQATYTAGVAATTKDQAALAAAAEGLWAQAVATAAANKRFSIGLQKSGVAGWKAGVASVGGARYSQGVGVAGPKYQAGVAPYFAALSSVTLPARGPKGSNGARVDAVVNALMAAKKAAH
jgi:hypothetical protein